MCRLEEKDLDILRVAFYKRGAKFYGIYKEVKLPLATAWRRTNKLLSLGFLAERDEKLYVTDKGLIALAYAGDTAALGELARHYGEPPEAVKYLIDEVCGSVALEYIPLEKFSEVAKLLDIGNLYRYKGTVAERLVAKIMLEFCRPCRVDTEEGSYVLGNGFIVAAHCRLCNGGSYELLPDCTRMAEIFSNVKKVFIKSGGEGRHEDNKTRCT
ncbi:hypothetical protein [Pyrobaculum neutrophilum]|uniref:Uncharacterized protein n=1 Tax=Pyrobaculum neutrophilum (strain DSM 2338 / JCM 9278 / NBRC 100436 / V24Sta) TaxID=444157 RepID=B1YBW7_PYRNV|nr:hypothetical protein [Pyrobaculum neutrophilum]ACB39351.1 conserved hypothetical protein [Pyrobaculum neutrophilum V24Sta]